MKIVNIEHFKYVEKTEKEKQKDIENGFPMNMIIRGQKRVPLKEPIYIVKMTNKEYQLVSFYLELEKRKPIMNVKIDTELKKGTELK